MLACALVKTSRPHSLKLSLRLPGCSANPSCPGVVPFQRHADHLPAQAVLEDHHCQIGLAPAYYFTLCWLTPSHTPQPHSQPLAQLYSQQSLESLHGTGLPPPPPAPTTPPALCSRTASVANCTGTGCPTPMFIWLQQTAPLRMLDTNLVFAVPHYHCTTLTNTQPHSQTIAQLSSQCSPGSLDCQGLPGPPPPTTPRLDC